MIDLCASCVSIVCDRQAASRVEDGRESWDVRGMSADLARRIEAGEVRITVNGGQYLPMVAVTTVNGSRLCGKCAREDYFPRNSRGARW